MSLAHLTPERQREIAAAGGKASSSRPFRDPAVARAASLKGVEARRINRSRRLAETEEDASRHIDKPDGGTAYDGR